MVKAAQFVAQSQHFDLQSSHDLNFDIGSCHTGRSFCIYTEVLGENLKCKS